MLELSRSKDDYRYMKKIKIELELNEKIVKKIERLTGEKLKELLEKELSVENGEVFIEMMGYDNE